MDQITVRDMLAEMETGRPFSITYVQYDRRRNSGGQVVDYLECKLLSTEKNTPTPAAGRTLTQVEALVQQLEEIKRNPNHQKWYTRNIRVYQNGAPTSIIKKIHPPLITIFNNLIVVA